ncbi:MAG: prepilin-type N-terminal cleavage/methylation domain-containing protein, partial [Planctomycetota bacterium]
MMRRHHAGRAFTLVEVLIVVIVLGILAAIVIPQFSEASTDAKMSALTTNLATIRGQIQLYKLQHNDTFPTFASFVNQMTQYTDISGDAQATKDATHTLGPYLLSIPNNPFTSPLSNTVSNDDSAT